MDRARVLFQARSLVTRSRVLVGVGRCGQAENNKSHVNAKRSHPTCCTRFIFMFRIAHSHSHSSLSSSLASAISSGSNQSLGRTYAAFSPLGSEDVPGSAKTPFSGQISSSEPLSPSPLGFRRSFTLFALPRNAILCTRRPP